ncbi:hypothetical protein PQX77_015563 [Marasmius sp. AFHP31]|nr:hypothetical protein PQX77_015563 [Marasmius sp. AFHP31]
MPTVQSKLLHGSLPVPLEVHQRIINALPTKDLVNYSLVSKTVHGAVRGVFRLETLLSPYFTSKQIVQFRVVQESTQLLISGSTAYAFFARERYPESDLDLYVDLGGYHRLMEFLQGVEYGFEAIQVERKKQPSDLGEAIEQMEARVQQEVAGPGFNELDASPEDAYVLVGICDVFNFTRCGKKVQVIVCLSNPLDVILSFHSISVVNQQNHSSHQEDVYKKYESRGLKILKEPDVLASFEAGSAFDPTIDRQPGDRNWHVYEISKVLRGYLKSTISQFPPQAPFSPPDTWTLVRLRDTLALLASEYPQSFQIMRCVLVPNRCKRIWVNIRVKITLPEGSTFDGTRYLLKLHRTYGNVVVEDQNGDLVYRADPMDYINTRKRSRFARPLPPPPPLLSKLPFDF